MSHVLDLLLPFAVWLLAGAIAAAMVFGVPGEASRPYDEVVVAPARRSPRHSGFAAH